MMLQATFLSHLDGSVHAVGVVLNAILDFNIFMDRGRDQRLGGWPEMGESAVHHKGGGKAVKVEHVIHVFCTSNRALKRRVHLCCPIKLLGFEFWFRDGWDTYIPGKFGTTEMRNAITARQFVPASL
jgi:hypothetical protein